MSLPIDRHYDPAERQRTVIDAAVREILGEASAGFAVDAWEREFTRDRQASLDELAGFLARTFDAEDRRERLYLALLRATFSGLDNGPANQPAMSKREESGTADAPGASSHDSNPPPGESIDVAAYELLVRKLAVRLAARLESSSEVLIEKAVTACETGTDDTDWNAWLLCRRRPHRLPAPDVCRGFLGRLRDAAGVELDAQTAGEELHRTVAEIERHAPSSALSLHRYLPEDDAPETV